MTSYFKLLAKNVLKKKKIFFFFEQLTRLRKQNDVIFRDTN